MLAALPQHNAESLWLSGTPLLVFPPQLYSPIYGKPEAYRNVLRQSRESATETLGDDVS